MIYKLKSKIFFLLLLAAVLTLTPFLSFLSFAQEEGLSLTVAPTLTRLNLTPGEIWRSSLRVVNINPYELTLYASVVDFEAEGEEGHGRFKPILEARPETLPFSLAQWIEIGSEPFTLKPNESINLPFSIKVPGEAEAGGHYAAILIGTQPVKSETPGAVIRVASYVSSLIFITVKGEVMESGFIREFYAKKQFYQKPEVDFFLRFENTGNVHLQPQGDITVYNMWGKERGKILVNHKTEFGNVLPKSVRKFEFTWRGEENFFDIGLYKAVATLVFGQNFKQSAVKTVHFWVVPIKPVAGVLGGLVFLVLIIVWLIRSYVRRALKVEAQKAGLPVGGELKLSQKIQVLTLPIREEVVDLRKIIKRKEETVGKKEGEKIAAEKSWILFLKKTYKFWLFVLAVFGLGVLLYLYFREGLGSSRSFEMILHR